MQDTQPAVVPKYPSLDKMLNDLNEAGRTTADPRATAKMPHHVKWTEADVQRQWVRLLTDEVKADHRVRPEDRPDLAHLPRVNRSH